MCVSELAAWLLYLFITQGQRRTHRHALSHAAKTVTVPVFAADHMSNQIECDNAFTPHHTHTDF